VRKEIMRNAFEKSEFKQTPDGKKITILFSPTAIIHTAKTHMGRVERDGQT
jgi:hypothetical protein